jgi:site-specific recombinase XerD
MAAFEKVKGSGVWYISYCDRQGKRHRERIGRRSEAETAYADRKREIREGRYMPPRSGGRTLTFRDLAEKAMADKRLRLAKRSYDNYSGRLKQVMPMLGHLEAGAIRPADIETVLAKLRGRGLCGSTANRYRSLLSSIFNYGVRMELARANPVVQVKGFKESEHRLRWLRPEEEERLREVISRDYPDREPEFDLSLYTGMRRGEQFTLKWSDVDLELGLLTVHGKTGRRSVAVNAAAKAALEKLQPRTGFAVYVCPETLNDSQRDWRLWFEDSVKKSGIADFRWHDNRHTYASRLAMAGVPLRTIQELLGHKSIVQTMKYAHLSPDHRAAAVEKIGRLPAISYERRE